MNPIGLVERPASFTARPRGYSLWVRALAGVVLVVFLLVSVVTTVVSLGAYCLATDAGNTAALPPGFLGSAPRPARR